MIGVVWRLLKGIYALLGSYGLSVALIGCMFVLTFLGTIEQVDHGLHAVQKKYFESLFLTHDCYGVPIPMPGGALVLALFGANLCVGGLIRIRKRAATIGIIIAHLGILAMLLGGLVTYIYSDSGYLQLFETQASDQFISYYDWELKIGLPGPDKERLTIPHSDLKGLKPDDVRTFNAGALPFEIAITGFSPNSVPAPVDGVTKGRVREVGAYYLRPLPLDREAEKNIAGAYVTLLGHDGRREEAILWGASTGPATIQWEGVPYTFNLAHTRYTMPFAIVLDEFRRELHPNTRMAASFESDVTMIEGATSQSKRIYMNHPLRHKGYTLFQASWGPQGGPAQGPMYSVFAVVRNPADQVPLYSCIVISIGLLIHFAQKLRSYIVSENRRRAA